MTENEADTVLALLCAGFPSVELPGATMDLWSRKLGTRSFEAAMQAADLWIDSRPKFPSVAEFLEAVDGILRARLEDKQRTVRSITVASAQKNVPAEHLHLWRAVMGQPPVSGCNCESCSSAAVVQARAETVAKTEESA